MPDKKKLKLVLCWHMHQPEYRDLQTGEFKLPWTYLHVIKDYVDLLKTTDFKMPDNLDQFLQKYDLFSMIGVEPMNR